MSSPAFYCAEIRCQGVKDTSCIAGCFERRTRHGTMCACGRRQPRNVDHDAQGVGTAGICAALREDRRGSGGQSDIRAEIQTGFPAHRPCRGLSGRAAHPYGQAGAACRCWSCPRSTTRVSEQRLFSLAQTGICLSRIPSTRESSPGWP